MKAAVLYRHPPAPGPGASVSPQSRCFPQHLASMHHPAPGLDVSVSTQAQCFRQHSVPMLSPVPGPGASAGTRSRYIRQHRALTRHPPAPGPGSPGSSDYRSARDPLTEKGSPCPGSTSASLRCGRRMAALASSAPRSPSGSMALPSRPPPRTTSPVRTRRSSPAVTRYATEQGVWPGVGRTSTCSVSPNVIDSVALRSCWGDRRG